MSKQKTQESETEEKEVTENPVEVTELDGLGLTAAEPEIVKPVSSSIKKLDPRINTVATSSVKSNKKLGVYKFLSLYPQDPYISTLLVHYYPHSFFTKDEWFLRIDEILNTPINN